MEAGNSIRINDCSAPPLEIELILAATRLAIARGFLGPLLILISWLRNTMSQRYYRDRFE
ncbi:MAG: hypothetical protein DMG90_07400 [Acidobacteria bacterium]|nr:MAG: hypothetical protein DMG90_07400 [Acidobacteriota bacterium]